MKKEDISTFDKNSEFSIVDRALPHWQQSETICFVTWRLADSLPAEALENLDQEINEVLTAEELCLENWRAELSRLTAKARGKVRWKLFQTREKYLDSGYGACLLSRAECARIVVDSLKHFDEEKYFLTDVVVMPNHIHFLCAFSGSCRTAKRSICMLQQNT